MFGGTLDLFGAEILVLLLVLTLLLLDDGGGGGEISFTFCCCSCEFDLGDLMVSLISVAFVVAVGVAEPGLVS